MAPTPERVIPIEENQGLDIRRFANSPKIARDSDFDDAYNKGFIQNNVGFYDDGIAIVKDGDQFLIGPKEKDGIKFQAFVSVANIDLLKGFIGHVTENYYRNLLSSVSNNINVDIATEKKIVDGKEESVNTIVIKEELQDLKQDITFQYLIDECKGLISGGILTAANGEKKFFAKGYYQEVLQLIMASRDKKDDTIYNKNLAIVTQILNEQKDNAAIIMTQAQELKNNNNKQNHAAILKRRDKELQHIFTQFSQIEKYVADPKAKREPFDAKTYNIELALYSSKDVQTLQEKIGAQDAEMAKIDAGMFNSALLKLDADDRQDFKVYLSDVIAGTKRPDTDKYTPRNETAFRELCATCPFVLGYINFTDKTSDNKNKNGETVTQEGDVDLTSKEFQDQVKKDPKYNDRKTAFEKGGIAGLMGYGLDKTNMTEDQKRMRGGVGQLAMVGGMVFVGWKMLSSAFNLIAGTHKGKPEEKRKDIARLLGPLALVFTTQAVAGEGPGALFTGGKLTEMIMGIGGKGKGGKEKTKNGEEETTPEEEKQQQEFIEKYGEGMVGAISVFHGMKYSQIKDLLVQEDGKMKIKDTVYDELVLRFGEDNPNVKERNPAGLAFLKKIKKNDDNNLVDLSLNAMGVTWKKLDDPKYADYEIDEMYSRTSAKIVGIIAFMEKHLYARINPNRMQIIEDYLADEDTDMDDLEDLAEENKDLFLKKDIEEETNIAGMKEKLETLAGGDKAKKEGLMIGMNMFFKFMPNAMKDIDLILIGTGPEVKFKTYGQETIINIDKKALKGFTAKSFDSYFELFKAANLINKIKDITKGKVAVKQDPFYILPSIGSVIGGDIMFNNSDVISTSTDERILSGSELKNNSAILREYKDPYFKQYLNSIRNWTVRQPEPERLDTLPAGLLSSINTIIGTNPERAAILLGLQRFYTNWPTSNRSTLEISGTRPKVKFTTYGETTEINLQDRNVTGLDANAAFADHFELFKAANLINFTKKVCKSKDTEKGLPYYKSGNDIKFDGKDGNIDVSTGGGLFGRFGKLDNVSKVLDNNKDSYVRYLNTTRDRTGNTDKIKEITHGNQEAQLRILEALNLFREAMPSNREKPIKISGTMAAATFETYNRTVSLNLNAKSINTFTAASFPDYLEMFKAASLTNRLKYIFRGQHVSGDNKFNISFPGGDIEFDGKDIFDIEAISGGRWGSLGEVSPTLENKKTEYKDRLNTLNF